MRRLGLRHPMLPSALAALVAVCAALLVAACAGPEKPQPAPLAANPASLPLRLVWSQPKGLGDEPLDIKADGENALLATKGGLIVSLSAANGAENWRLNLGAGLTSVWGATLRASLL